jgi:hypothetical protein
MGLQFIAGGQAEAAGDDYHVNVHGHLGVWLGGAPWLTGTRPS